VKIAAWGPQFAGKSEDVFLYSSWQILRPIQEPNLFSIMSLAILGMARAWTPSSDIPIGFPEFFDEVDFFEV